MIEQPNGDKQTFALPVVNARDYRHAVPGEMWELLPASITGPVSRRSQPSEPSSEAISQLTQAALRAPMDFPSIGDAVLAGDHVALAVDPNVPRAGDVIDGGLSILKACGAGRVSIVMWPETPDGLLRELRERFQNFEPVQIGAAASGDEDRAISGSLDDGEMQVHVAVHRPDNRSEMRYVAADADAEAIYLARDLVDADWIVPIVAARVTDAVERFDKAAVFPLFADAATIRRYQHASAATMRTGEDGDDVRWLLGIQLMVVVSSNAAGDVGRIVAGTPDAIRRELRSLHIDTDTSDDADGYGAGGYDGGVNETLPRSELVIAALDGDAHAQTWANVARAAIAASRHVEGRGTIVVWSRLNVQPGPQWQKELVGAGDADEGDDQAKEVDEQDEDDLDSSPGPFGDWQMERVLARKLAMLIQDYSVLLHSELTDENVESVGLGVIGSVDQLRKLGESFQGAGVLRAAQFHDGSVARFDASERDTVF